MMRLYRSAFPLLGITCFSAMAASAAAPLPPPLTPLTHPISTEPRISDGPWVDSRPEYSQGRGEPPLPLSKVRLSADGSALYSRMVNQILCVAADSGTQKTWLGNALGVKMVDRKAGVVRHYDERDGLPVGSVLAIAADASGEAWCIVRGQTKTITLDTAVLAIRSGQILPAGSRAKVIPLHLCAFQPTLRKWKILRTLTPAGSGVNDYSSYDEAGSGIFGSNRLFIQKTGRPRITVGSDAVTFSIGMAAPAETTVVYQWDRKLKRLETISWEEGLRADNPALFVTFLATDAQSGGLWIGTNAGLLYRARTTPQAAAAPWKRLLPDQVIGEGTAAIRGGGVWVTTTTRLVGDGRYRPEPRDIPWKLYRVSVSGTGDVQTRDVTPPPPTTAPDRTAEAPPRMARLFDAQTSANMSFPAAVVIDSEGALWLAQKGVSSPYSGFSAPQGRILDAWWKRDPQGAGWMRYEMRFPAGQPFSAMAMPTPILRETTLTGAVHDNVTLNMLPDAAILPLALHTLTKDSDILAGASGYPTYTLAENPGAVFWMRRRFPAWICPDDSGGAFGDTNRFDVSQRDYPSPNGPAADPSGPEDMVWVMDSPGTTLLYLPRNAMPEDLRRARSEGYGYTVNASKAPPVDDARVEHYPFPAGRTIRVRPDVAAMVSDSGAGNRLFIASNSQKLMAYDTISGTFSSVPLPQSGMSPSRYNPPVVTRAGSVIVSGQSFPNSQMLRFDPKDGSFRALGIPGIASRVFGVAPNDGLWIVTNENDILFQAPGDAPPIPLPNDLKSPPNGNNTRAMATDYLVWTFPGGKSLVGYDVERTRRTPPLDLIGKNGYPNRVLKVLRDGQGGAYVASEDSATGVFHYDRERNEWEVVAPPPVAPTVPGSNTMHVAPLLASATDREIWLLTDARYLMRYNRKVKAWETPVPIPLVLRGNSSDNELSVTDAENGAALYVGGRAGLWRYDKKENSWTEKRQTITLSSSETNAPNGTANLRVTALAVTPQAVFTLWNFNNGSTAFAARLDTRTKTWSFYDESKGFPERDFGRRLVAGGGSAVWLIHGTGTYYFDAKQDLWRRAFGKNNNGLSEVGEPIPAIALGAGKKDSPVATLNFRIADIVIDPKTGDSFVLGNPQGYTKDDRPIVFRCDPLGKVIAQSAAPRFEDTGMTPTGALLLPDNGAVLIAANTGVYRAFGTGSPEWERVPAPAGFELPAEVTRVAREKNNRGLYVLGRDTVAYWASF